MSKARTEVAQLENMVVTGKKKFVRYAEGAQLYSLGLHTFQEIAKEANAVYTDVWISMGEEALKDERIRLLTPFQVNQNLMDKTENPDAIFLHCLPAVKGQEVTEDVIEGKQSKVWEQAENRKHTIKAIMLALM